MATTRDPERRRAGSAIRNEAYRRAGATIVETAEEVWHLAALILRVKEPLGDELELICDRYSQGTHATSEVWAQAHPLSHGWNLACVVWFSAMAQGGFTEPGVAFGQRTGVVIGSYLGQSR